MLEHCRIKHVVLIEDRRARAGQRDGQRVVVLRKKEGGFILGGRRDTGDLARKFKWDRIRAADA